MGKGFFSGLFDLNMDGREDFCDYMIAEVLIEEEEEARKVAEEDWEDDDEEDDWLDIITDCDSDRYDLGDV